MKTAVFAGTIAALLIPATAFAGGVAPAPAPAPAPVAPTPIAPAGYDWSGAYGGIQLEYGDVDANTLAGVDAADGDGVLYGLFGGYRYDFGSVVVGAEIDLNLADIDLETPAGAAAGTLDSVHRIGGEVGYDAGPLLVYGTAGFAQASATIGGTEFDDNGYFYGAGVDYLVTDQIVLGAEVLQHEFEEFDSSGLDVSATTFGISAAFRF